MAFLNPAALWFLLALAVPILVHLFNFQRPKRVLFSNLALLADVQKTVVRRVKLRQWLLLAARLLAVAAGVFVFANPVILDDNQTAAQAGGNSVAIVLDDSWSMEAADEQGIFLEQARLLAQEILAAYPETDEFQIHALSNLRLNLPYLTRAQAREQLDQLTFAPPSQDLRGLLQNAPLLFTEARFQNRRLFFLSDFQRSTVLADSGKAYVAPEGIRLNFLPLGSRVPANVFIGDIQLETAVPEVEVPVKLFATVKNAGPEEVVGLSLRTRINGREVALATVDRITPFGEARVEVVFTPRTGGWLGGEVEIDDPSLPFDNTRYFSLYLPERERILVVQGEVAPKDQRFMAAFLSGPMRTYPTKTVAQADFPAENLSDYRAVVLQAVEELSSGLRARLARWTRDGGGLLVFPGENNVEELNALLADLNLGKFGAVQNFGSENPAQLQAPDLSYPLFRGVFEAPKPGERFESPSVFQVRSFSPGSATVQATVLALDRDGLPFLQEAEIENGRALVFAAPPHLSWTDLPLKSTFVPLLHRGLLRLLQGPPAALSATLGALDPLPIQSTDPAPLKLIDAQGQEILPPATVRGGKRLLTLDGLGLGPGLYTLQQGDSTLRRLAFNLAPAESQLNAWTAPDLEAWLDAHGLPEVQVTAPDPAQVRAAVQRGSFGLPLWKWFLALALLALTAEIAIARWVK